MGCVQSRSKSTDLDTTQPYKQERESAVVPTGEYDVSYLLSRLSQHNDIISTVKKSTPKWAETPQTEACVSLSCLNKLVAKASFTCDEKDLLAHSGIIVSGLSMKDDSFNQHMVYFLYKIGTKGYSNFMEALITGGILKIIVPFLSHRNSNFSLYTAFLCEVLYKNSVLAKDQFYELSGIDLISKRKLNNLCKRDLARLLNLFLSYMTDSFNKPIEEYAVIVSKYLNIYSLDISDLRILDTEGLLVFQQIVTILLNLQVIDCK